MAEPDNLAKETMETWTDDDGVTHDMSGIWAKCFLNVSSVFGPAKNDDPPRVVTCLNCLTEDKWASLTADMAARGVTYDRDKLKQLEELWALEKLPLGPLDQ